MEGVSAQATNKAKDKIKEPHLWFEPAVRFLCARRSHHAVIRVYDAAGYLIETHEHKGEFKMW